RSERLPGGYGHRPEGARMSRLVSRLFAVLVVVAFAAPGRANLCGDVTGDGVRAMDDVQLILNAASGKSTSKKLCGGAGIKACGDVDKDGQLTVVDAQLMLNYVSKVPSMICGMSPPSGRPAFQELAMIDLPLGVTVNTIGGNLLLRRDDLSVDTYLG